MPADKISILIYTAVLTGAVIAMRLFAKPLKYVFYFLLSSAAGCGVILLINTFAPQTGLFVGLNTVTASVCGLLGVPGALLLAAISFII